MQKSFVSLVIVALVICARVSLAQSIITTIAGNGIQFYSGDNGTATNAELSPYIFVRGDAAGNIYISDAWNYRIRKVDGGSGIIHTIAGNGISGYTGDGGQATDATIRCNCIALDAMANIYFTDSNRIRKIDAATGIVHSIAGTGAANYTGDGGTADTATFNNPAGLFVDAANNIYICDLMNNVIRKIDATTNMVSTIAGNGYLAGTYYGGFTGDGGPATAAELDEPTAICLDATGNIYICDGANERVRKIDAATGIINTIAGLGAFGMSSGDGGPAVDAYLEEISDLFIDASGNIYLVEDVNSVRKIDRYGIINTIAGNAGQGYNGDGIPANTCKLYYPSSVYCDAGGNIYIGDGNNMRVRKINTSGIISTFAGTGTVQYSGDGGPAINAELFTPQKACADAAGNIYFTDQGNNRIRKINSFGIIVTVAGNGVTSAGSYSGDGGPATDAQLSGPAGICIDRTGNVYFADLGNKRIRRINATSGIITTVAGNGSTTFSGDGGPATDAGLSYPSSLCIDAWGSLYFSENGRIREVDMVRGLINTFAGNGTFGNSGDGGAATDASLGNVGGLCTGPDGSIYFSDTHFNVVRKIDWSTGVINTVAGNGFVLPINEGCGIYDYVGGYDGDGGPANAAELNHPTGIFMDNNSNLYISDAYNNVIRVVNSGNIINTIIGNGYGASVNSTMGLDIEGGFSGDGGEPTHAELFFPNDVCLDHGNIIVIDAYNNRIRHITNPTSVHTVVPEAALSIFPNPTNGLFTIDFGKSTNEISLEIDNITGSKIYESKFTGKTTIDLNSQPPGVYLIFTNNGTQNNMQKIILTR